MFNDSRIQALGRIPRKAPPGPLPHGFAVAAGADPPADIRMPEAGWGQTAPQALPGGPLVPLMALQLPASAAFTRGASQGDADAPAGPSVVDALGKQISHKTFLQRLEKIPALDLLGATGDIARRADELGTEKLFLIVAHMGSQMERAAQYAAALRDLEAPILNGLADYHRDHCLPSEPPFDERHLRRLCMRVAAHLHHMPPADRQRWLDAIEPVLRRTYWAEAFLLPRRGQGTLHGFRGSLRSALKLEQPQRDRLLAAIEAGLVANPAPPSSVDREQWLRLLADLPCCKVGSQLYARMLEMTGIGGNPHRFQSHHRRYEDLHAMALALSHIEWLPPAGADEPSTGAAGGGPPGGHGRASSPDTGRKRMLQGPQALAAAAPKKSRWDVPPAPPPGPTLPAPGQQAGRPGLDRGGPSWAGAGLKTRIIYLNGLPYGVAGQLVEACLAGLRDEPELRQIRFHAADETRRGIVQSAARRHGLPLLADQNAALLYDCRATAPGRFRSAHGAPGRGQGHARGSGHASHRAPGPVHRQDASIPQPAQPENAATAADDTAADSTQSPFGPFRGAPPHDPAPALGTRASSSDPQS